MSKKVWWVVEIILVLILFSGFSVAYTVFEMDDVTMTRLPVGTVPLPNHPLTFNGGSSCAVTSGSASCTSGVPSFRILSTDGKAAQGLSNSAGGFTSWDSKNNVCTKTNPLTADKNIIPLKTVSDFVSSPKCTSLCLGYTNIFMSANDDAHMVLGGYLYAKNSFPIGIKALAVDDCSSPEDFPFTYTYLALYPVSSGTNSVDYNTIVNTKLDSTREYSYLYTAMRDNGFCGGATSSNIPAGVYYIEYVLSLDGDSSESCGTDVYKTFLYRSADTENSNIISNSDFTIYPDILSAEQILAKYDDATIDSTFCVYAGGKNSSVAGLPHSGCCREKYKDEISGNYVCDPSGEGWTPKTSTSYCEQTSGAKFNQDVLNIYKGSNNELQFIKDTKSGSDGCCGDDTGTSSFDCSSIKVTDSRCNPGNGCFYPNDYCAQYFPKPNSYDCPSGCAGNYSSTSWRTEHCIAIINDAYSCKAAGSYSSKYSDNNFISSNAGSNQYMCLGRSTLQNPVDSKYTWFNAASSDADYLITTLNVGSKVNDVISNGKDWYYCNANGANALGGKPVPEYSTFANKNTNNQFTCGELLTLVTGKPYPVCSDANEYKSCCMDGSFAHPSTFQDDCSYSCYDADNNPLDFCKVYPSLCSEGNNSAGGASVEIRKDSCLDPALCLDGISSYTDRSCEAQPIDLPRVNCLTTQACIGGISITTNNASENCCVGNGAHCADVPSIKDDASCLNASGKPYPTNYYVCDGASTPMYTGYACCFGSSITFSVSASGFGVSNSSFMCFKENGNNLFADCCYDSSCSNDALLGFTKKVYYANGRVQSLGSALHTFQNFDWVDNGQIVDYVRKLTFTSDSNIKYIDRTGDAYRFDISGFQFIEFDIAYTMPVKVKLDSGNTLSLSKYLTNGDKPGRWHHAVIPVADFGSSEFTKLFLIMDGITTKQTVLIDNIILTPPTGSSDNSQNRFCTGGFQGWISDFDPPAGASLRDWNSYGPYMLACNSQAAFGWTGSRCCGDDTRRSNYGEFYNDSQSGCFNGTNVKDGWSLAYAKNYYEGDTQLDDELSSYKYSGLLYYNRTFIGCQLPGNDIDLYVAQSGAKSATKLVQNVVTTQCGIKGSYYCMNGIWRQKIVTSEGNINATSTVTLKTIPPGAELLKTNFKRKS